MYSTYDIVEFTVHDVHCTLYNIFMQEPTFVESTIHELRNASVWSFIN